MPYCVTVVGWILFVIAVAVIALKIAGCVRTVASKEAGPDMGLKILLGVTAAANIIGYVWFALSGANLSARDLRYAAAAVSILAVFAGLWYDRLTLLSKNKTRICIMSISAAFAVSSLLFYILVGVFAP